MSPFILFISLFRPQFQYNGIPALAELDNDKIGRPSEMRSTGSELKAKFGWGPVIKHVSEVTETEKVAKINIKAKDTDPFELSKFVKNNVYYVARTF